LNLVNFELTYIFKIAHLGNSRNICSLINCPLINLLEL